MYYRPLSLLLSAASCVYARNSPGVDNDVKCGGVSNTFVIEDMLSIINGTAANTFTPQLQEPFPLLAKNSQEFGQSSAQLCVANDFIFDNTHVFLTDIGQGGLDVVNQCCDLTQDPSTGTCNGGTVTLFGDSGLSLILTVESTNNECGATIQADSTGALTIALDIGEGLKNLADAIGNFINSLSDD